MSCLSNEDWLKQEEARWERQQQQMQKPLKLPKLSHQASAETRAEEAKGDKIENAELDSINQLKEDNLILDLEMYAQLKLRKEKKQTTARNWVPSTITGNKLVLENKQMILSWLGSVVKFRFCLLSTHPSPTFPTTVRPHPWDISVGRSKITSELILQRMDL